MPPTLANPVPKPAPIPAKTVPRGLCNASRRRPISSSVASTMISSKAIFCDSATGTFVVRSRPKGSPIKVPTESRKTVFFWAFCQLPRIKSALAAISSHQHKGINSTGGIKLAAEAMATAESAKPEKPRTSPAAKQISDSAIISAIVRASALLKVSNI